MSEAYICVQCGVQFAPSPGPLNSPPASCPICEDKRQYVNWKGQAWTTMAEMAAKHENVFHPLHEGVTSISTKPRFAIGQQALLIESPAGNVLWDCLTWVDEATVAAVNERGGITAIAISHPHFYDGMVEWSRAFGDVPIYLNAADREWVMRPDANIVFWDGPSRKLNDAMTLVHCGGHFEGSSVMHWSEGAGGKGALFAADTVFVVADRRHVTFMRSYPNMVPLAVGTVDAIVNALEPYEFDRIYGIQAPLVIESDAKAAVHRSAERYKSAMR